MHHALGIAYRQVLRDDAARSGHLARSGQRQQRSRVSHVELVGQQQRLHRLRELGQPQQIAHRAARTADGRCSGVVRQLEFLDQARNALRLFERIEVFALNVLDQRQGERRLIRHAAHQRRNVLEARTLRGAPAAFAGDDLETRAVDRAHQDRLHDALGLDRLRQLDERRFVHARARLILAGHEAIQGDRLQRFTAGAFLHARQQRIETATQPFELSHASFLAPWRARLRPAAAFRRRAPDTLARPWTTYRDAARERRSSALLRDGYCAG